MSDSKLPDAQSGMEKGYTVSLAAHSGANMIYESAGMQASLLGFSHESLVIDNDMLGAINRTVRGIEVNEETLEIELNYGAKKPLRLVPRYAGWAIHDLKDRIAAEAARAQPGGAEAV